MDSIRLVEVTGDATVDWMLMNPRGPHAEAIEFTQMWGAGISCRAVSQPGGAALLASMLEATAASQPKASSGLKITGPPVSRRALVNPAYEGFDRTFISWSLFPKTRGDRRDYVWRISEFWGQDPKAAVAPTPDAESQKGESPDLLVIDDSNLGFRQDRSRWPAALTGEGGLKAIVLKMSSPLAQGSLWAELVDGHSDIVTVVVALSDMRKSGFNVGYALSWEQIYAEISAALKCSELSAVKRVVVLMRAAGAVLAERNGPSCLVFDRFHQEGDWEKGHPGIMMGYSSCMVTSIAWEIISHYSNPDIVKATNKGVSASRSLHVSGFEQYGRGKNLRLRFPFKVVADTLEEKETEFDEVCLSFGEGSPRSILDVNLKGDYDQVAMEVALRGPANTLSGVPIERIGDWSSVDRGEIESMRSVRNILSEYVTQYAHGMRLGKPLSIAVFGPPGAGKSFAIKQMAKALFPDELTHIEFNLSQFETVHELGQAFHEVRDLALEQRLPLVFLDEFDTPLEGRELGWLRYFLAPMQDGQFKEGGIYHPIGPAIFVFAGGTCSSIEEFKQTRDEAFEKDAKKKDFISRLRGYINILGPNPLAGGDDRVFPLRRALLLRALLGAKAGQLFEDDLLRIDPGVLRAFLTTGEFLHGARSMGAIVDMSAITGKLSFERSSLPAENQLALHVDPRAFLEIVDSCARE